MSDEGEDDDEPSGGFSESGDEAELVERIRAMDDATLLHIFRTMSHPIMKQSSLHLTLLESEILARGLMSRN